VKKFVSDLRHVGGFLFVCNCLHILSLLNGLINECVLFSNVDQDEPLSAKSIVQQLNSASDS
jgi:hypothetical protein